jgi:hypothetical protein
LAGLNTVMLETGTSLVDYATRINIDTSGNVNIGYGKTVN